MEARLSPKVLIIDDDPTIREVLASALHEQGFSVTQLADSLQSLHEITFQKPDIVLLDVMMPGMDGFEVCRIIRQTPEISRTAVVFLTARSTPLDIERGLQLGADDYITKPFDIFQLGDRLHTLVKQRIPGPVMVERKKHVKRLVVKKVKKKVRRSVKRPVVAKKKIVRGKSRLSRSARVPSGK